MDILLFMAVSDSWTSSCSSATQDSIHQMMDYKQSQKHYNVLKEKMGPTWFDVSLRVLLCIKEMAGDSRFLIVKKSHMMTIVT